MQPYYNHNHSLGVTNTIIITRIGDCSTAPIRLTLSFSYHRMLRCWSVAAMPIMAVSMILIAGVSITQAKPSIQAVDTTLDAHQTVDSYAAQVPFGALRLSPSIGSSSNRVRSFTHHDGTYFGVMPLRPSLTNDDDDAIDLTNYESRFSSATSYARPGFVSMDLIDTDVTARLTTAGTMTGVQEYQFRTRKVSNNKSSNHYGIIVEICTQAMLEDGSCKEADVSLRFEPSSDAIFLDAHLLTGVRSNEDDVRRPVDLYLTARISAISRSRGQLKYGLVLDGRMQPGVTEGASNTGSLGAYFEFGTIDDDDAEDPIILIHSGISFINSTMAQWNMNQQLRRIDSNVEWPSVDQTRSATAALWAETLGLQVDEEEYDADKIDIGVAIDSPSMAPPQFGMITYLLNDTRCVGRVTGSTEFPIDTCVLTPAGAQPQYHSLRLYNVDLTNQTYSINIYGESPACDDFVGWYTNGTLGYEPADCQSTDYFSFRITEVSASSSTHRSVKPMPNPIVSPFYSLFYRTFLTPMDYTEAGGAIVDERP